MKTILVPVDFSAVSRSVAASAADLARATGARLVLLHVVEADLPGLTAHYGSDAATRVIALREEQAEAALRPLAEIAGPNVELVVAAGLPDREILAQADRLGAELIVVGSHGHTALYELILGGTTRAVLKHAACPVIVIPSSASQLAAEPLARAASDC